VYLAPGQGEDGALRAYEVYGLDARRTDLVVLSACDTNVGSSPVGNVTTSSATTQPISTGDEVLSLGRAFLTAGASSVIASLWKVDDASTAALMDAFYHHWQEERRPKAEALRLAQADVRAKWPNPYFWAGFVLNGDPSLGRAHVLVQQTPTVQPAPTLVQAAAQPTVPQQEMATDATSARVNPQSPTPNRTPAAGGLCGTALVMVGLSIGVVSLRRKRNWME
jgi:hypothetical protein